MLPVAGCVFFSKHLSLVRLFITVRCSTVFKGEREGRKAEESNKKSEQGEAHSCDRQIKPCEVWTCTVLWKPMGSYVMELAKCESYRGQTSIFNKYKLPDCPNQILRTLPF